MRRVKSIVFFISISLSCLFLSCRPQRQLIQTQQRDSVVISDVVTEKVVRIAGDSVTATLPLILVPDASTNTSEVPLIYKVKPAKVTIDGKRAKVDLQIKDNGEVEATAVCKELEEKVTVLERTVESYQSEVSEYQVRENLFKRTIASAKRTLKTVVITAIFLIVLLAFIRSKGGIASIISKLKTKIFK